LADGVRLGGESEFGGCKVCHAESNQGSVEILHGVYP